MVIEEDVIVNEFSSLFKCSNFLTVDAFRFQNGEEVFGQSVIIGIPASLHGRRNPVFLSQLKVRLGSILKALVTVELQLCSDLLISLSNTNGVKNKTDCLLCTGLVGDNAVVIEVADHREVKEALSGTDVRNVCYPLLVGPIRSEVPVEQIRITVKRLSVLHIPLSPNSRKQTVLVHYFKDCFGIVMDSVPLQPYVHSPVAIGTLAFCLALTDLLGQRQIFCRVLHPLYIPIVAAA